jgi:integrase
LVICDENCVTTVTTNGFQALITVFAFLPDPARRQLCRTPQRNRMPHDVCTRADVPQLRVPDLRHSCTTLLFTMGVQPATVQRILRHSFITVTTGTYVEVIEHSPRRGQQIRPGIRSPTSLSSDC